MRYKFYKNLWFIVFLLCMSVTVAFAQEVQITGTVLDETDMPLPGVTILLKGTTTGTTTDLDGKYSISAPKSSTLVFSFIGYDPIEIEVGNQSIIDLIMNPNASDLEEVVVIGYGTAKKRDITGAVSSVNPSKLENENPNSVQDILRGNAAGLNVGISTSAKGGGSLQVRGQTSLNAGNSPLLVLDGAIYYGELADINPNDIENLEVLKDASAAAVFGAKAANGVILITTKKGTVGKSTIKFNANAGLATMATYPDVYGPDEFIGWREDVFKSINAGGYDPYEFSDPRKLPSDISLEDWMAYDGSSGDPVTVWLQRLNMQPEEIKNYLAGNSVDWRDKVFQTGFRQDYTVSLSGRTDNINYYWSVGYLNNEGIIIGDEYETIRTRVNLEGKVNKWLTVGMNVQFATQDESTVPVSSGLYRTLSPWGSEFNEDGTYKWRPNDEASGGTHPFYDRTYIDRTDRDVNINSTLFAAIKLPFGFNFRTNFTPRFEYYEYFNHQSAEHAVWGSSGGIASRRQRKEYYWQIDNILTWQKTFAEKHDFNATFLVNAEKFQSWDNTMTNNGFEPHDRLGYHNIGGGINPIISSNDEYSTGDALMGRLIYSYDGKYSTTVSLRRDGYSAFGQSNPRALFYSAAVGWVFSDENFINIDWLDFGKMRFSWGSNGNRDIGRYVALSDLNTGKYFYERPSGELYLVNQLYVNRMQNSNLQWERTESFNLGIDFSILKTRLTGTIEMYKMATTDLLVQRSLPDFLGFNYVWDNLGQVDNKGFELTLNSTNFETQNLTWRTTANFQLNRNEIISLYGDLDENGVELDDPSNGWFIGHSIDQIWNYKTDGIWQSDEAEAAAEYGVKPGDFKVVDVDGDGKFTNADRQFQGYTEPRFRWSLRNEFTLFKNLDVSFMMYSYWGHEGSFNQMKNRDGFLDRTSSYVTPYWTEENPNNEWARLNSSEGSAGGYSIYRKKSFIRLENISMGYNFPKQIIEKAKISNLRVYGSIRNVGFFAPEWDFWDPENSGPIPRYFTLGIDVTL
ncbi:TonB-linked SusC/RagA family outer membrane protein [Algoriphagus ratkowskyi]|uniref:SusC/RagA family TonB-linked outer membrane protein n=1 Tax=Algoriphagus ratkowskyi TaxID=57028 RepID=A0A2W7RB55_9BACT|nr:SusC/RagA family TonB-linked outer membrane protein [Algoriphagus ratkowskyi]PZX55480.1 TonB-linked SusC/RagA family outer membrane protein [Algoriphagus ratkowskyi]TXD79603.1 SusC/RagA family TonB-linked outer membrane protein [Algoriphagus ratkowskyi]